MIPGKLHLLFQKGDQCWSAKNLDSIIWPAGTAQASCKKDQKKKKKENPVNPESSPKFLLEQTVGCLAG